MISISFKFIIYPSYERALKNGRVKSKIVKKSPLNFTFGQGSCFISDFARRNSNKAVLIQVFLRFEVVIFNNNFVFCMMSSFCSMTRVADLILTREIIQRTNVLYPACLKKYWKKLDKHLWRGLFCESCTITHHSLLKMNHNLLEIWGRYWLKYEKINKLRKIWKDSCFKLKKMNYINCQNKKYVR